MKNVLKLTVMMLFIGTLITKAQDKLYKTNGEVLETKVMEIGATEIKYKVFANMNGPMYSIGKEQVFKIVYENGKTESIQSEANTANSEVKRAQNIFVEVGAQGLLFTANYDTRFSNKRNGIGGRAGIGAFSVDGLTVVTAPIGLNYLLGEGKNFFEIGVGATYIAGSASSDFFDSGGNNGGDNSESTVIGTMAFMYRLQPVKSGFSFRGGFTPIFSSDGFIPYYAGISLGYTF